MNSARRSIGPALGLAAFLATTLAPAQAPANSQLAPPAAESEKLLQYTAGGHILGFQPDGLYIAGGDHALHIGFVGSAGTMPEAAGAGESGGKAPPLTAVAYADLWPGVSLCYEAAAGGIAESTWEIDPGADVGQIRLRYNAPVEIEKSGSLKISYETGWMRESAPVAWQEIGGERRPVEVAFRLVEEAKEEPVIGFEVRRHDPAHPLLIDPTLQWNTFMGSSSSLD